MGNSISDQIGIDVIELIDYINSRLRYEDPKIANQIGEIGYTLGYHFSIPFLRANRNTYQKVSISIPIDINRDRNDYWLNIERGEINVQLEPPPPIYEMALIKDGKIFYWSKGDFGSCLPRFEEKNDVYNQIIKLARILLDRPIVKYLSSSRLELTIFSDAVKKLPNKYEKKMGILFGRPKNYMLVHISSFLGEIVPSPMIADPDYSDQVNHVEDNYPNYSDQDSYI
jgi:hypothetical protein